MRGPLSEWRVIQAQPASFAMFLSEIEIFHAFFIGWHSQRPVTWLAGIGCQAGVPSSHWLSVSCSTPVPS
jgi:hypothetical protein